MYLGVDIGGTKTLVAVLNAHGVITESVKFPTDHDYPTFVTNLKDAIAKLKTQKFAAAGVGMAGPDLDRKRGIGIRYANLPWVMAPVRDDLQSIVHCPVAVENDAKLAGLSEAMLHKEYSKVLYITISTGIGTALIVDQHIDENIGDNGGSTMLLQHHGKTVAWESFASGKAIVRRFGKRAADIDDDATWKRIVHDWRQGFLQLLAITEPDIIVIGGSVGTYLDRYGKILVDDLKQFETPLLPIPPIVQAQRPEEAVIYGCYDYAKQVFGAAAHA